jgi:hypothetical protein
MSGVRGLEGARIRWRVGRMITDERCKMKSFERASLMVIHGDCDHDGVVGFCDMAEHELVLWHRGRV